MPVREVRPGGRVMDDCRCPRCLGDGPDDEACPNCDDDCTCAEYVRTERAIDAYEDRMWA